MSEISIHRRTDTSSIPSESPPPGSAPIHDRFERLDLISWFDRKILRSAKVLVAGAGALANETIKNLVLMGIGRIAVCDFDTVELSNLSRSVLFTDEDVGMNKAEALAKNARRLNPDCEIVPLSLNLLGEVGTAFFGLFDVVIGAVDTRVGRLALNRACWKMTTPFIDGGLNVLSGVVKVFLPPSSACYECTLNDEERKLLPQRNSCNLMAQQAPEKAVPTTTISASLIGALQAQEALKILHPELRARRLQGEGFDFDGGWLEPLLIRYPRKQDDQCGSHETYAQVHELPMSRMTCTLEDLRRWMKEEQGLDCKTIGLDRDMLIALFCEQCEKNQKIHRPLALYGSEPEACPDCGSTVRRAEWTNLLRPDGESPDRTVASYGIPPMDVLSLQTKSQEVLVTLTDDRAELLPASFFA